MELNPYTPGGRPRVFVGRDEERRALKRRLGAVATFGEMAGPLMIFTGPRGLGKTSLLRDAADHARAQGFVVVWVVGVKRNPVLPELVKQVMSALERADVLTVPRVRQRITELGVRLNLGVASVEAKFAPQNDARTRFSISASALEDLLHEASTAVRDRGGAGLFVVIDELHAPLDPRTPSDRTPDADVVTDIALLLNIVQNMDAERDRYPLAVVGAGLPQTKALLTQAATFGERTQERVLTEFDESTSRAVLTEPARQLGVGWTDEAVDLAVARADGYPQALQVIGAAAWEAADPEEGDAIEREDIERSSAEVDLQMLSMFEARWGVASAVERRLVLAMALMHSDVVLRGDIADHMGVSSADLSVARASLISKGVIESAGRGMLRFTMPGFAEFVRARVDE